MSTSDACRLFRDRILGVFEQGRPTKDYAVMAFQKLILV